MAKLFISHSSKDKEFCHKLSEDLRRMGHTPFLDTYDIQVGDDIVEEIGTGISDADYVVLVLTPESVDSTWVKKEWRAKFWAEIDEEEVRLLPALLRDCSIPIMLQTKKYADFRKSYAVGFAELVAAIPTVQVSQPEIGGFKHDKQLSHHIETCQDRNIPLTQCLPRILTYAVEKSNEQLLEFCRLELSGYRQLKELQQKYIDKLQLQYRVIELFVSPFAQVNLQAVQWGQNASTLIDYLRRDDKFYPFKLFMPEPIGELEAQAAKLGPDGILTITVPLSSFMPETDQPDVPTYGYAHPSNVLSILNGTRARITSMLMEHLPGKLDPNNSMHLT